MNRLSTIWVICVPIIYLLGCLILAESHQLNKRQIGEGNWALIDDIPTPTNGRVRLSDEREKSRQQLRAITNSGEQGRFRRWIRDGDIDRERGHRGNHQAGRDSDYNSGHRNHESAAEGIPRRDYQHSERRYPTSTRDGEGRRYR